MVILHIASINDNQCDGICVAVPCHIMEQSKLATVGFVNITNEKITGLDNIAQYTYNKKFDINKLPEPFNKADIVIFHGCYRIQYIDISNNLNKNNIPYIVIPHGELRIEAQKKKKLKKTVANVLIFNRFIKNAIGIQCLSLQEYQKTDFVNNNKFVATNGVSMPNKRKNRFNNNKIIFLYIGRLEVRVKGLDLMIEAISRKAELMRKNNCILEIYGPDYVGRYKEVQELIIKNDVKDIVKLNHEIVGKEKESALLNCDIFIQTSRHEGMSMGILEALSYGIPCIVTVGTNMKNDILKYNAGWCADNNVESISNALEKAINDNIKFEEYGNNAIDLIKNNYSWKKVSKQTIQLYRELI